MLIRIKYRAIPVVTSLALLMLIIAATVYSERKNGEPLFFAVLSQDTSIGTIRNFGLVTEDPELIILQNQQEVTVLETSPHFTYNGLPFNNKDVFSRIRTVNYQKDITIFVFQGLKSEGGYSIDVNDVRLLGDTINIHARFGTLESWHRGLLGGRVAMQIATDPYQIITIEKENIRGRVITFNLIDRGTIVYSVQVSIV